MTDRGLVDAGGGMVLIALRLRTDGARREAMAGGVAGGIREANRERGTATEFNTTRSKPHASRERAPVRATCL